MPLNISMLLSGPIRTPVSGFINTLCTNTSLFTKLGLAFDVLVEVIPLSIRAALSSIESCSIVKVAVVLLPGKASSRVVLPVMASCSVDIVGIEATIYLSILEPLVNLSRSPSLNPSTAKSIMSPFSTVLVGVNNPDVDKVPAICIVVPKSSAARVIPIEVALAFVVSEYCPILVSLFALYVLFSKTISVAPSV